MSTGSGRVRALLTAAFVVTVLGGVNVTADSGDPTGTSPPATETTPGHGWCHCDG
jgi:hypothetical protein